MKILNAIYLSLIILFSCNSGNRGSDNRAESTELNEKTTLEPSINTSNKLIENLTIGCSFNKISSFQTLMYELPREREIQQIKDILKYSGLPSNFEVIMAPVENAMATMINNKRYIIYDPTLLINADYGTATCTSSN